MFAQTIDQRIDVVQQRQAGQEVDDGLGSEPRYRGAADVLDLDEHPRDDGQQPGALEFERVGSSRLRRMQRDTFMDGRCKRVLIVGARRIRFGVRTSDDYRAVFDTIGTLGRVVELTGFSVLDNAGTLQRRSCR
ncbi:MAG: hypothetical protein ACJ8IK_16925 [Burkholderiaceae bacterium]